MVRLTKAFNQFGPAIITAALVFGPGSITITTKLGATFGDSILWVVVMSVIFMLIYTRMSTRIGLSTDQTLMTVVRESWGTPLVIILGLGIFLITCSFQAGNSIGAGVAFAELTDSKTVPWVIFFVLASMALLFFKSFYLILEKIMIGLVLVMLISFLITLILSQPDLISITKGLIPTIPKGSVFLSSALIASSFSVVGAFYQSYLVQEKGWRIDQLATASKESRNGIIVLGILSTMVLLCASSVLHEKQIEVNTASDLGLALQPLFGRFATVAFMIGFFAASFSSLIGNATIGGALLSDALGAGKQLSSVKVRIGIALIMITGAGIAIAFGGLPIQLIIFAQAITIVIAPLAALVIVGVANRKDIMGLRSNTPFQNILAWIGLLILILLAIYNIFRIFFPHLLFIDA